MLKKPTLKYFFDEGSMLYKNIRKMWRCIDKAQKLNLNLQRLTLSII